MKAYVLLFFLFLSCLVAPLLACEKCEEVYGKIMRDQYNLCNELYYAESPELIATLNAKLEILYALRELYEN